MDAGLSLLFKQLQLSYFDSLELDVHKLMQMLGLQEHIKEGSPANVCLYEREYCTALLSLRGLTDPTVSCSRTNLCKCVCLWIT
jgi:hypothetical protein